MLTLDTSLPERKWIKNGAIEHKENCSGCTRDEEANWYFCRFRNNSYAALGTWQAQIDYWKKNYTEEDKRMIFFKYMVEYCRINNIPE